MKASISPNDLPVFEYRGQIVTDSRDVAAMLGKRHADIMRTIDTMARHLNQRNFASVEFFTKAHYKDAKGESRPCYYLTQMGCEMVAHKQTGEAGTIFTARYVKAFHAMRDFIRERNSPEWQGARTLGQAVRQLETDAIKEFVEYARRHGSQNAGFYYANISTFANRLAGVTDRDKATTEQTIGLLMIEKAIARELRAGMEAGQEYREIYQGMKRAVERQF